MLQDVFTSMGDIVSAGLEEDEVSIIATTAGTELQVMVPSTDSFSAGFSIWFFRSPRAEGSEQPGADGADDQVVVKHLSARRCCRGRRVWQHGQLLYAGRPFRHFPQEP